MSKNLRISLFGLTGAFAGFVMQGCFAPQPTPECSVTITAAGLGLAPYFVKLNKVSGTGACSQLTHMYTGLQRYRTAASGGAFTLAVKSSPVVDPYLGYVYAADYDPYNNCVNEEDCQGEDDPEVACVINVDDGGIELNDGTPVDVDGVVSGATLSDGGAVVVDLANECASVEESVERRQADDPNGKNLNAIGDMPQFPANNVCAVTNWKANSGAQNFQEEVIDLADGTQTTLPAITYKIDYTNFNVVNSTKVPGTAFTADVKYTEGSCVAEYKAVGFWPEIHCSDAAPATTPTEKCVAGAPSPCVDDSTPAHVLVTSTECDPNADLDAGRVFGSGINPEFKPMCDTDLGVCVPTVDVTTIK